MADETLSFSITGRDDGASSAFRRVGDSATLAARGARLNALALEQQRKAADASARSSISLANADKILADAEKALRDDALQADAALRAQSGSASRLGSDLRRLGNAAGGIGGRSLGGGNGPGGAFYDRGLLGGIGPGILGINTKWAALLAGGGLGLGALPALTALGGALGIGGIAAKELIGSKQNKGPLYSAAKDASKAFTSAFQDAAKGLEKPLKAIFAQIPQFVHSIAPELKALFSAVGPLLAPLVHAFEGLVKGLLPGFVALMRAALPAVQAFSQILSTLGKDIGSMFTAFAPVIRQSALIFKALAGVVSGLFPVIGKLAAVMASALGPVFATFAKVIQSLEPTLVIIGKVLAGLAGAILTDLVSAFTAVATLVRGISPALNVLAKALSGVFTTLENSGVFAILGDALEKIAKPLAKLISALITGLAPILPPVIRLVSALASDAVRILAGALGGILPILTRFVSVILRALAPVLGPLAKAITQVAGALTKVLLAGLKQEMPVLDRFVKSLGQMLQAVLPILPPVIKLTGDLITLALKALVPLMPAIVRVSSAMEPLALGIFKVIGMVARIIVAVESWLSHWRSAGDEIISFTKTFVGNIAGFFRNLAGALGSAGKDALSAFWDGAKSIGSGIIGWVKSFVGGIVGWFKKLLGIGSPSKVMFEVGKNMMRGLEHGIRSHAQQIANAKKHAIGGGLPRTPPGPVEAVARRLFPWPASQWPSFNAVEMREAGYSLTAQNPSSGAYGVAQFINGPQEYFQYGGTPYTAAGQFTAMFNYIRQRYGTPDAAWQHELSFGWYDRGGYLKPGLTLAYNGTGRPEPVGAAIGGNVYNISVQVAPGTSPVDTARQLADILNKGAKSGVRLRKSLVSVNG